MKKKKGFKKTTYILVAIALFLVILGSTYGRYIYMELKEYYLSTKNFYFSSDKLTLPNNIFHINS